MISTRPDEPIALDATHDTRLTISEAPTAVQKPEIVKPGTSHATSPIIAGIEYEQEQSQRQTVIGSVSMNASGRTNALTMPSSSAAMASLAVEVKCRPSNSWLATQRPSALMAARSDESQHG